MSEHELFDSPDSLLASCFSKTEAVSKLVILTGESGAGKTTFCQALIARAVAMNLCPCGVISPAIFESGNKVGIDLIDIASGESKRLATRRMANQPAFPSAVPGRQTLNWLFHDSTLDWGNAMLDCIPCTDFLILDEIGPLELLESDGLTNGLKRIDEHRYRLACVVVRPSLLATALERWPWGIVWNVSESVSGSMKGAA